MGSTAYNEDKIEKQRHKFGSSTSGQESFRFCGMEIYLSQTAETIFRNKYWGRSLKIEQIEKAFALCFSDGRKIRQRQVQAYIDLLE